MVLANWQIFRALASGLGENPKDRLLIVAARVELSLMQASVATQCPDSHNLRSQRANGEIPDQGT